MVNNIIVNKEFGRDYGTLYHALNDSKLREGLKQQAGLDPGFRDLMRMLDDPVYARMSKDVSAAAKGLCPGMVMPKTLEDTLQKLQDYAGARYAEGWKLLNEYENTTGNRAIRRMDTVVAAVGANPNSTISPIMVVIVTPSPDISPLIFIAGII